MFAEHFNAIIQSGQYPQLWKEGIAIPIFKNGDPNNPGNYRGITVTNTLSKLFCHVINNRITHYLEENNLIIKEQAGFRQKTRTSDHIFVLKKIIDFTFKKKNNRLYTCFVDFSKAFDNIWHDALFMKMLHIGITGKCFSVIKNMYENATVCGRAKQGYTKGFTVRKGVLQGNVISPNLFNIFINDITDIITIDQNSPIINSSTKKRTSCLLYADDLVLLSTTKSGLQCKLNQLYEYCKQWGLTINKEKTKVMIFTKNEPKVPITFSYGDEYIETVEQQKYLGVIFHKSGSLQCAQEHLSKQANKANHVLRRTLRGKEVNIDTVCKLFDILINPIMSYSSEIWLPYSLKITSEDDIYTVFNNILDSQIPSESLHMKFCRNLLGVHKKASKIPVLAELGRYPLCIQMICQTISFWAHITESDESSYLKEAYMDMKDTTHSNTNLWTNFIKHILNLVGMSHVWQNQGTFSAKRLKYSVTAILETLFKEYWLQKKSEKISRYHFYHSVSKTYQLQPYLTVCRKFEYRRALCQLRISAHDLHIEKGRYSQTPRDDRKCLTCNVVEDELHFLDECLLFHSIRSDFIQTIQNLLKQNDLYLHDMTKPSHTLQVDCFQDHHAKFVYDCFQERRK